MQRLIAIFAGFGMVFSSLGYSQECCEEEDEVYYTQDDDDLFNKGKFVGAESDEYQKRIRRERMKNWGIALTTTAIGAATVVLVGNHHRNHPDKK